MNNEAPWLLSVKSSHVISRYFHHYDQDCMNIHLLQSINTQERASQHLTQAASSSHV